MKGTPSLKPSLKDAVTQGDINTVRRLLESDKDLSAKHIVDALKAAIRASSKKNYNEIIKALLNAPKGCPKPSQPQIDDVWREIYEAQKNAKNVVKALLNAPEGYPKPSQTVFDRVFIQATTLQMDASVVKALLNAPEGCTKPSQTVLHVLQTKSNPEINAILEAELLKQRLIERVAPSRSNIEKMFNAATSVPTILIATAIAAVMVGLFVNPITIIPAIIIGAVLAIAFNTYKNSPPKRAVVTPT